MTCEHKKEKITYRFAKQTKYIWEVIRVKTCKQCFRVDEDSVGITHNKAEYIKLTIQ